MKKLYENIIKAVKTGLNEGLFDEETDILDGTEDENILADKIAYDIRDVHDELEILFKRFGSLFHDVIIKICKELSIKSPNISFSNTICNVYSELFICMGPVINLYISKSKDLDFI